MSVSPQRLVVAAAALVLAVFAYHAVTGSQPRAAQAATTPKSGMPSFLRFQGSSSVAVRPDRAVIHFSTAGHGTTLIEATNDASKAMRRVLAAMTKGGVAKINMATDGGDGSKNHSTGLYDASQSLTVTVMKVGNTGKLITAGINAGATANYGPEFSAGMKNSAQGNAIKAAVANARRKADEAAHAAGLHVTSVVSVSEAQVGYQGYNSGATFAAAPTRSAAALEVPIRRGSQTVNAAVTVVFAYAAGS